MKITRVSTAIMEGNFPWVLVKIEADEGITGLGEAYWGVSVAEGRSGDQNTWVVNTLLPDDVLAVDLFGKIEDGALT